MCRRAALKDYNEATIRSLISQLIEEGYLYQTDDQYSVLKVGDVSALGDESTRVVFRTYESRQPDKPKKPAKQKARSTDALTAAGYKLFEQLRKLRLEFTRSRCAEIFFCILWVRGLRYF